MFEFKKKLMDTADTMIRKTIDFLCILEQLILKLEETFLPFLVVINMLNDGPVCNKTYVSNVELFND